MSEQDPAASGPAMIDGSSSSGPDWIDETLADPTLSPKEKRQRIQDALDEFRQAQGAGRTEAFEPLETRIFDALSLLADGGHDYGTPTLEGDAERDEGASS